MWMTQKLWKLFQQLRGQRTPIGDEVQVLHLTLSGLLAEKASVFEIPAEVFTLATIVYTLCHSDVS
jgi:hypothetical protein